MPEELTPEQKALVEQIFIDPATFQTIWPYVPFNLFWRTNNFIQRTMSHLFALDTTQTPAKWIPLEVDSQGRLEVSSIAAGIVTENKVWDGTTWQNMSGTGAGEVNVVVTSPLPTGDNNIGNIDVVSLPVLNLTFAAPANVSVGTTSTLILAANSARKYAIIVNDSANTVYLGIGSAAVSGSGIRLNANGGAYELTPSDNMTTAAIYGIAAAVSNVTVHEAT